MSRLSPRGSLYCAHMSRHTVPHPAVPARTNARKKHIPRVPTPRATSFILDPPGSSAPPTRGSRLPVPRSGPARGMKYSSSRVPLPPAHRRGSRPPWSRIAASTAPWSPPALPLKARPRAGGDHPQLKTRLRSPGSSETTRGCVPTWIPCFPPSPTPGSAPSPSQRRPSGSSAPATPSPTSCRPAPWAHW